MQSKLIVARLLVAVLVLLAPAGAVAGEAPPEPDGARVYRDHCSRCHAPRAPSDLDAGGWRAAAFHMRTRAYLDRAELEALERFLSPPPATGGPGVGVLANPLVATACVLCHPADRVEAAVNTGRSLDDWLVTVGRMRTYGAAVSPAQVREIAAWLAESPATP